MSRILIGNIKGPQGAQGIQGPQGPVGATGPQGPMPPLINNALATEAGVAALDAAMGKNFQDQITQLNSDSLINRGKIASISTDTEIISLETGVFTVQLSGTQSYIPSNWGNLTIYDTGEFPYKRFEFVSTDGNAYYRLANKLNNTWYTDWKEIASKSDLPTRLITGVNNENDIPLNTFGTVESVDSSLCPAQGTTTYTYQCFGSNARKTLIFYKADGTAYIKNYTSSAWSAWSTK